MNALNFGSFTSGPSNELSLMSPALSDKPTVSFINADGSRTKSIDYMTDGTKEPDATGVSTFAEVVTVFQNLKKFNIPPFLVLDHITTVSGVDSLMPEVLNDGGSRGWDWGVRKANAIIATYNQDGMSDYILVGHATAWRENISALYSDESWAPNFKTAKWLYAHKSICFDCTAKSIVKLPNGNIFCADVTNGPDEVSSLYFPLGLFGNTKSGKCVAILRAFLKVIPWPGLRFNVWEECCGGPIFFLNQGSRRNTYFANTLQVKYASGWDGAKLNESYEICVNVDEAINNWIGCIVRKTGQNNSIFQGFLVAASSARNEINASAFMRPFCNTSLESSEFPDICACLGRAGVEDALRNELNNDSARMVCQSKACADGDRTGNIYTFIPSPPCTALNICKPGLDVNAARLTMTNVTFNCGGVTEPVVVTTPGSPPGSSSPPPAGSPPPPPPAGLVPPVTPPGPPDTNTTNIIIGSVVGVVVLIVIIVVTVVLVRRKKQRETLNK